MSVDFDRMAAHLPADQRKQLSRQYRRGAKHDTTAFLSGFFLGTFGAHHFYLGEWARGFAHLIIPVVVAVAILAGVAFSLPSFPIAILVAVLAIAAIIWEIVDLFRIDETVHRRNLALAESLVGAGALADNSTLSDAMARLDSAVMVGAAGVASSAAIGSITADDLSAARDLAGAHSGAIMEEFDSTSTKYISDDPNATSPGAPGSWSETMATADAAGVAAGATESNADDTLDMPAPEYVTHTHTETEHSVTDSYEFDRSPGSPDSTQPMPIPTAANDPDATWPNRAAEAGLAAAGAVGVAGLAAHGGDVTDHHAVVPQVHPIGDVEDAGDTAPYVSLPEGMLTPASTATSADDAFSYVPPVPTSYPAPEEEEDEDGYSPLMVDTSTIQHDSTDAHPQVHHAGLVADVETNPSQPVYVTLPEGGFAPAAEVSAGDAALAGLAGAGLAAGAVGAGLVGATPPETPEAAPTSGPLMKRIRMKRQIVVDGKVVREEIVEKLVPADTDTSSMVAEMDTQLGHASKEEIAHMANLDPNESLEVRHRMNTEPLGGE